MNASSTDRIERQISLKAPRSRVWQALADAESFGTWFGVDFKGQRFVTGEYTRGHVTYPGYEHVLLEALVERVEPERYFSFRWHPYAIDPKADYADEPTTLVEFLLEEHDGGTLLRVVESGFDRIPAERRHEAYRMNSKGWESQIENIRKYVDAS